MLKYKNNVLLKLKEKGFNTNRIRQEKIFTQAQLQNIRDDHLLTHDAFSKLCRLLECQPGDLLEWVPDESGDEKGGGGETG